MGGAEHQDGLLDAALLHDARAGCAPRPRPAPRRSRGCSAAAGAPRRRGPSARRPEPPKRRRSRASRSLEGVEVLLVERRVFDARRRRAGPRIRLRSGAAGTPTSGSSRRPPPSRARSPRDGLPRRRCGDRAERVLASEKRESSGDEMGDRPRAGRAGTRAAPRRRRRCPAPTACRSLRMTTSGDGDAPGNRPDGPEPRERLGQRHRDGRRATAAAVEAHAEGEAEPRRARDPQKRAGRSHSVSWGHGGAPSRNALK